MNKNTIAFFFLALGWLLPYHYRPWISFHADVCSFAALFLLLTQTIYKENYYKNWYCNNLFIFSIAFLPLLQFYIGKSESFGIAILSSVFIFGFFTSINLGSTYKINLLNGLIAAILISSIISVGLQLQQWFGIDTNDMWAMQTGPQRPYANLGQPNQLATLLLWGILATAWGWQQKKLSSFTTCFVSCFILFGVALTGSRTAWIGILILVSAAWAWRNLWRSDSAPRAAILLALYFAACVATIAHVTPLIHFNTNIETSFLSSSSAHSRLDAWKLFLDAIAQRPWFGYGWNQTALAQIEVAVNHPSLGIVFTYAHNLFLDLLIWCGIPLGLLFIFAIIYWFWKNLKAVNHYETAILMMMILVISNHAMLEFPLYYAYFLLPVGLFVGVINARHNATVVFTTGKTVIWSMWLVCAVLLAIIIKDYLEVEESYRYLRYEQMNIKVKPMGPPDVILLTQWYDQIDVARIEPPRDMSEAELQRIEKVVSVFPSALLAHKVATALALNNQPDKARLWLRRLCKISPEEQCKTAEAIWTKQALKYPEIAAIPWPVGVAIQK